MKLMSEQAIEIYDQDGKFVASVLLIECTCATLAWWHDLRYDYLVDDKKCTVKRGVGDMNGDERWEG
jgi:hypothetical protein